MFKSECLKKYFPVDVRTKKEIEFLELKQGNMTLSEYSSKFKELVNFFPHYNSAEAEGPKCIKFERCLRSEIKLGIGY